MERTVSNNNLQSNSLILGNRIYEFQRKFMTIKHAGGPAAEAVTRRLDYGGELQRISISRSEGERSLRVYGFSAKNAQVFFFTCGLQKLFYLLKDCEYNEDFIIIINFRDPKEMAMKQEAVLKGRKVNYSYTLIKYGEQFVCAKMNFKNGYICFELDSGDVEKVHLSRVEEIRDDVHLGNDSIISISTADITYEILCTSKIRQTLNLITNDLSNLSNIGDTVNHIVIKGTEGDFYANRSEKYLKIYDENTLDLRYEFEIEKLGLYLGSQYLILQHEDEIICSLDEDIELLCKQIGIRPTALHTLVDAQMITHDQRTSFVELLLWQHGQSWYMFEPRGGRMIRAHGHSELRRSREESRLLAFKDGLIFSMTPVDFLEAVETPAIVMTTESFPTFFERLNVSTICISIPGKILWENSAKSFYEAKTHQEDEDVVVDLHSLELRMPIDVYKENYKRGLIEMKTPSLSGVPITMLMTSRARNLSDMLIYEFFGQWQILLDYMSSFMDEEKFSEKEMTNYGLFMYHAIYQQRKRMEEVASKFPYFMSKLANEIGFSDEGSHIYQKQQRQLFQLSAQLKSQFVELENLLSQMTYVHSRNDEYQKSMNRAYKESSRKKMGGALIAGIGVTVLTGGLGLILPAMTLFSGWTDAKLREELTKIQIEKEFKRNEFLFKKAVDLIRHMNAFTIDHHVNLLNQFTFENLKLEAREIIKLEPNYGQRERLLKQSVHMYAKNTLPVDFNQALVPQGIITSILGKSLMKDEEIESLFLN